MSQLSAHVPAELPDVIDPVLRRYMSAVLTAGATRAALYRLDRDRLFQDGLGGLVDLPAVFSAYRWFAERTGCQTWLGEPALLQAVQQALRPHAGALPVLAPLVDLKPVAVIEPQNLPDLIRSLTVAPAVLGTTAHRGVQIELGQSYGWSGCAVDDDVTVFATGGATLRVEAVRGLVLSHDGELLVRGWELLADGLRPAVVVRGARGSTRVLYGAAAAAVSALAPGAEQATVVRRPLATLADSLVRDLAEVCDSAAASGVPVHLLVE